MKKYIILAFASLLALSSCESFLDRSPLSDLSPSSYFKDKAEMKNWNAGIYDAFQSALSKRQVLFGDVRSDNVTGLYECFDAQYFRSQLGTFFHLYLQM